MATQKNATATNHSSKEGPFTDGKASLDGFVSRAEKRIQDSATDLNYLSNSYLEITKKFIAKNPIAGASIALSVGLILGAMMAFNFRMRKV